MASSIHSARVLVADDQQHVLEALSMVLKGAGYQAELANSPARVLEAVGSGQFDAVLMDLNYARDTTSGQEGLDLLTNLRALDRALPVVVMTAWSTVNLAVEAMQRGADDFVEKPWDNARLLGVLERQIQAGHRRRQEQSLQRQEFDDAAEIQHGLLPRELPRFDGFEIAVAWKPARSVSGDYYDLLRFDDNCMGLAIGDVAGKGVPAALLMSNLQASVRVVASGETSPGRICSKLSELFAANLGLDRFITFFYARLCAGQKRLRFCRAGHNAPLLVRVRGEVERLEEGGTVIGGPQDPAGYEEGETLLSPGDRLLLFTDGLPEARNAEGEEFSEARVAEVARENRHLGPEVLRDKVMDAVTSFCGGTLQDDATLIVLAVN